MVVGLFAAFLLCCEDGPSDEQIVNEKLGEATVTVNSYYETKNEDGTLADLTAGTSAVAEVNGTYFDNLQSAVDAANGKTVKLLKDVDVSGDIIILSNVTLDLNGYSIDTAPADNSASAPYAGITVETDGKLTVHDSNHGAHNNTVNDIHIPVHVHGTFDLMKPASLRTNALSLIVYDKATANINGGEVTATLTDGGCAIEVLEGGTLNVNKDSVISGTTAIDSKGLANIKGGTIYGTLTTSADGKIVATGGYFSEPIPTVYCEPGKVSSKDRVDGFYYLVAAGASVTDANGNTFYYYSLAEAAAAAKNMAGAKIEKLNDNVSSDGKAVTLTGPMTISKIGQKGTMGVKLGAGDSAKVYANGTVEVTAKHNLSLDVVLELLTPVCEYFRVGIKVEVTRIS